MSAHGRRPGKQQAACGAAAAPHLASSDLNFIIYLLVFSNTIIVAFPAAASARVSSACIWAWLVQACMRCVIANPPFDFCARCSFMCAARYRCGLCCLSRPTFRRHRGQISLVRRWVKRGADACSACAVYNCYKAQFMHMHSAADGSCRRTGGAPHPFLDLDPAKLTSRNWAGNRS